MGANRLIHETSPYLRQHADNPVDWYPWGEEAFARARRENKAILLSIGYSACHWCHVMEHESFENQDIARSMNENFVNIKVDREERPDLDEIYMNAVQMLTGRGGWPMTVFLTPEGRPFYGGTYYPPEDRYGVPGFPKILRAVAEAYRERSEEIDKRAAELVNALKGLAKVEESQRPFSGDLLRRSAEQLSRNYDPNYGGLGRAPKFPNTGAFEVFLRYYWKSKDQRFLDMVTHTLTQMALGGIYDHLGGGFHRYSVDERWLVPHFEKMLYDNAQLILIHAQAFCVTRNPLFRRVIDETLDYLLREMLQPEGGFYSTQDADSEGEEGKFFVWTREEIVRILGDETGAVFCRIYDVSETGNFEGKNIVHPIMTAEQASKYFKRDISEIEDLIAAARKTLFQERERRPKPFRDEKILASWNGLMLSALAEALKLSFHAGTIQAAEKTVGFIFARMFQGEMLFHSYKDRQAKNPGYLDDYAFLAAGLINLHEVLPGRGYMERALQIVEKMIREFWDEREGGFFYSGVSHEPLITRTKPFFDGSVPSGNSIAAQVLLKLYHHTGREEYLKMAERLLRLCYDGIEKQAFGFAHMLAAFDFYMEKPKEIVLLGDESDPGTKELLQKIHSVYLPNKILQLGKSPQALGSPLLAGKTQVAGKPTVFVCHNFTCSLPVTEWEELKPLLER
ncbi:MAG: thioredoxin domain-containing protein [Deltaproteobacteria bacterium]|nr:thioredoxin domain-containing protein [Deltaproteobacteria bacterium]